MKYLASIAVVGALVLSPTLALAKEPSPLKSTQEASKRPGVGQRFLNSAWKHYGTVMAVNAGAAGYNVTQDPKWAAAAAAGGYVIGRAAVVIDKHHAKKTAAPQQAAEPSRARRADTARPPSAPDRAIGRATSNLARPFPSSTGRPMGR